MGACVYNYHTIDVIDDVIDIYNKAIYHNISDFQIFNVGFGKSISIKRIAEIIRDKIDPNVKI